MWGWLNAIKCALCVFITGQNTIYFRCIALNVHLAGISSSKLQVDST